jgi:hypothetical protein
MIFNFETLILNSFSTLEWRLWKGAILIDPELSR